MHYNTKLINVNKNFGLRFVNISPRSHSLFLRLGLVLTKLITKLLPLIIGMCVLYHKREHNIISNCFAVNAPILKNCRKIIVRGFVNNTLSFFVQCKRESCKGTLLYDAMTISTMTLCITTLSI